MTQLQTISNNHMSLECRCGHRKLVSVKELIIRLNPPLCSNLVHRRLTPARLPSVTNQAKPTVDHVRESLWADTVSVLSFIEKVG